MSPTGFDGFLETVIDHAHQAPPGWQGSARFVMQLGEECAFIHVRDVGSPVRFLRQMAGQPPLRFGTDGFNPAIVDDGNPARHYMAFVVAGFWLPAAAAVLLLYVWELLGLVRYGHWSAHDVACGWVGLHHGRCVRRHGPWVLPPLLRRDVGAQPPAALAALADLAAWAEGSADA